MEVALASLSKRSFNVSACVATGLRVVTEAEAAAGPGGGDGCSVLVAHRADRTWLVIVRSPSQPGKVWAVVTVTAGGEGVAHIDYKP